MSRNAEVIVLAQDANEVMEPLTRYDDTRTWGGVFYEMRAGGNWGFGWGKEFPKSTGRSGLLKHLESLPWPRPETVQVLIHDEEDDCFGLWMIHNGALVEVPLPGSQRFYDSAPPNQDFDPSPGYLWRDGGSTPFKTTYVSTERQDPRPAW
ncbi:hypothetical protein ACFYNY_20145 [Streptomyces sp. NPDC006530]|uniref:hypothetical protein n=1 Tax=Streptomyces sp. NPDC006530 TaxID=3364750 RepID=UPI00368B74AB